MLWEFGHRGADHNDNRGGNNGGVSGVSGCNALSLEQIGDLIDLKIGNQNVKVHKGTPKLDIDYQSAMQTGVYDPLAGKQMALREGDKIQIHVTMPGGDARYLYLFWADTFGKVTLLWPEKKDLDHQMPVTEVSFPDSDNPNEWELIDANHGIEMALVAVSDEPMTAAQIEQLTALRPSCPARFVPRGCITSLRKNSNVNLAVG